MLKYPLSFWMFCYTSHEMFVGIVPQSCSRRRRTLLSVHCLREWGMSAIPIDHLSRDDLVTLLYRVAAKLATLPVDPHIPQGTPYPTAADCGWIATEAQRGRYWATRQSKSTRYHPMKKNMIPGMHNCEAQPVRHPEMFHTGLACQKLHCLLVPLFAPLAH